MVFFYKKTTSIVIHYKSFEDQHLRHRPWICNWIIFNKYSFQITLLKLSDIARHIRGKHRYVKNVSLRHPDGSTLVDLIRVPQRIRVLLTWFVHPDDLQSLREFCENGLTWPSVEFVNACSLFWKLWWDFEAEVRKHNAVYWHLIKFWT